ncbi:MAG TPA: protein-disulfide reductase DsbD domain-containing protein [Candidatus Angelobacter sp.]|nr:protein-disulfide reductase DsbD domain-containing protein [Candidatus Angelobacter sp.]
MKLLRAIFAALCLGIFIPAAHAAHTQAQLLLANDMARRGDTVLVGVDLKMAPGWHTYWKNPGSAGMATKVQWQLPRGVTAGDILWPLPKKLPPAEVITYGYEDETMLIVPLKLASDLKPGPLDLKAKVSWLECKEQCIPAGATVEATLNIGSETKPSTNAPAINLWKNRAPRSEQLFSFAARWEKSVDDTTRTMIIQGTPTGANVLPIEKVDFFPGASDNFEVQGATEKVDSQIGFALRKTVKKFSGDWPSSIGGLVIVEGGGQTNGFEMNVPIMAIGTATPARSPSLSTSPPASTPNRSLALMLFYAFIGGLILNIMPCVLPVIALKILGFVSEAHNDPKRVRMLGIVYSLGVLASFWVMAALVIGIQSAGHRAGWGMQFSNPYFLIALTVLITLVALNLFGVFEVNLGSGTMSAASTLAGRQGVSGAFFNGVLTTILATPCTAAILGTALGFAFAHGPAVIVLMFSTMGIGLAFPYLLLSFQPAWLKFLPKPGAWMEKFKIAMGFPMLIAAIWLFSIASIHYGDRSWWLAVFLVFVAIAAWVYGEFVQRGRTRRGFARCVVILVLIAGYFWPLKSQLRWNEPLEAEAGGNSPKINFPELSAEPWSAETVALARAENHPVLVDFTAKWCVTCNSVVAPALQKPTVQAKLKEINARVFVADYSLTPPEITDELARYGRAGVPLVLVYPKDPSKPAIVLQEPGPLELPSHYAGAVLTALDQAAK